MFILFACFGDYYFTNYDLLSTSILPHNWKQGKVKCSVQYSVHHIGMIGMTSIDEKFCWSIVYLFVIVFVFATQLDELELSLITPSPGTCSTKCCASKTITVAFASSMAFCLASTLGQLLTTLCNRWKLGPEDLPQITFFGPSPFSRTLYFWLAYCWLTPYAARLVGCSLHMLQ